MLEAHIVPKTFFDKASLLSFFPIQLLTVSKCSGHVSTFLVNKQVPNNTTQTHILGHAKHLIDHKRYPHKLCWVAFLRGTRINLNFYNQFRLWQWTKYRIKKLRPLRQESGDVNASTQIKNQEPSVQCSRTIRPKLVQSIENVRNADNRRLSSRSVLDIKSTRLHFSKSFTESQVTCSLLRGSSAFLSYGFARPEHRRCGD